MTEPVQWSAVSSFLLLGQVQAWILVVALLSKLPAMSHDSALAGRWLAALMACLAVTLNIPLLQELGLWLHWPRLLILLSGLPLLFGPLLFAHVAVHTHQQVYLQRPFLYGHLVLPVLFYLLILPLLGRESSALQDMLTRPSADAARFSLIPALKQGSFIFYSVAALFLLNRYEARLRQQLAEVTGYTLGWLRLLVWATLILVLMLTVVWATGWSGQQHDLILAVSVCLCIIAAAFHGLRGTPVFVASLPMSNAAGSPDPVIAPLSTGPGKPLLEASELAKLQQRLDLLPADTALLFDYNLSLDKLAAAFRVRPQQLSWALNQVRGQSFYDFINGLRVDAVRQRLQDPALRHQSILDIALSCGFSNKTTFNKAFKAQTGETPSAWRRLHTDG
jgi:AraC-like DNA-binding protein